MDYKKAYEAALERAKGIYNENPSSSTAKFVCGQIFPELKESEDERIRKELIDFVNHYRNNTDLTTEQAEWIKKAIAYLEKQKEQKPAEWSEKKKGILLECISALQNSGHWLLADKLSSLRPQPHWKPSEEQIEVLNEVVGDYRAEDTASCEKTANILESLYNDLESL